MIPRRCAVCGYYGATMRFGLQWYHPMCWARVRDTIIAKDATIVIENEAKTWDSADEPNERANARPALTTTLPPGERHGMAIPQSITRVRRFGQ